MADTPPAGTPAPHTHPHAGGHLSGLKSMATKKIGPLPAIAWAGIGVVLLLGIRYYLNNKAGTSSTSTTTGTDATGTDTSSTDGGDSGVAGDGTTSSSTTSDTNAAWGSRVATWLVGHGATATDANNAVDAYLNGHKMTAAQAALINKAIAQFGEPPEGILPINVSNPVSTPPSTTPVKKPPAKKPVKKPPAHPAPPKKGPKPAPPSKPVPAKRYYTVKAGDTLSAIARRYYGNDNWQKIYDANKGVIGSNPNLIRPGERLVIPS